MGRCACKHSSYKTPLTAHPPMLAAPLFVHVGQCGVQLGKEFWDLSAQLYGTQEESLFEAERGTPRAFFLDSEPKVVAPLRNKPNGKHYHIVHDRSGRGNCWAMGFNGLKRDLQTTAWSTAWDAEIDSLQGKCLNEVRRMLEREENRIASLIWTTSMAGGTGSGLTSRLLRDLRDSYPKMYMAAAAVWPFSVGEIALQHYNTVLTLAHLQEYTDAIIMLDNDTLRQGVQAAATQAVKAGWMQQRSTSSNRGGGGDKSGYSASMTEMNRIASLCLTGLLGPEAPGVPFDFGEFQTNVTPMPAIKCAEIACITDEISQFRYLFPGEAKKSLGQSRRLLNHVAHEGEGELSEQWIKRLKTSGLYPKYDPAHKVALSLLAQCSWRQWRTSSSSTVPSLRAAELRRMLQPLVVPVLWNPHPLDILPPFHFQVTPESAASTKGGMVHLHQQMTLVSNRSTLIPLLLHSVRRVHACYRVRAYFHWFQQYGCSEAYMEDSMETVKQMIADYSDIFSYDLASLS